MPDYRKILVYLNARDSRELQADGFDPAEWVRETIKAALQQRAETRAELFPAPPDSSER